MKVCTDACIFGAVVVQYLEDRTPHPAQLLDVGAGTGLLSLMIAQQMNGCVDAIEIDDAASHQAAENFRQSPWSNRLQVFKGDALAFDPGKKYDYIISNPPFYEGDLTSPNPQKNAAKHDTAFTLEQLLFVIGKHLSADGTFAVLLPYHRVDYFRKLALAAGYSAAMQLLIRHTIQHPFFRGILFFSRKKTVETVTELVIKNEAGEYTPGFIKLLEDYYLYL